MRRSLWFVTVGTEAMSRINKTNSNDFHLPLSCHIINKQCSVDVLSDAAGKGMFRSVTCLEPDGTRCLGQMG